MGQVRPARLERDPNKGPTLSSRSEITVHMESYEGPLDRSLCGIEDDEALMYPDSSNRRGLMVQDWSIQDAAREGGWWRFVRCAKCAAAEKKLRDKT